MRYRKGQGQEYIQDRRGVRPTGMAVGGGGIVAVIIAVVVALSGGGGGGGGLGGLQDIIAGQLGGGPAPAGQVQGETEGVNDDDEDFMGAVMASLNDVWADLAPELGIRYQPVSLVLFSGAVDTGCGRATAAVGPFYCPPDQLAYIDLDFFAELSRRFGAPGDFAQAYVIAHEVGHHITNLQGNLGGRQSNEQSIRTELQADCYAGIWANQLEADSGSDLALTDGDIREGLGAAAAVGDDRIQEQAGVDVNPETWTHGSAEQRTEAFSTGYRSGDPNACRL